MRGRLGQLEPGQLALRAIAVSLALGFLGVFEYFDVLDTDALELDGELSLPALWSALLLLMCAVLALAWAAEERAARRRPIDLWTLGAVFGFMAVDEFAVLHEQLDDWFGVENFILAYLPLVAAGALGWVAFLRRPLPSWSRRLWLVGAGAWVCAQALELPVQAEVELDSYLPFMWTEEMLEMGGSICFALAMMLAHQAVDALKGASSAGAPRSSRRRRPADR